MFSPPYKLVNPGHFAYSRMDLENALNKMEIDSLGKDGSRCSQHEPRTVGVDSLCQENLASLSAFNNKTENDFFPLEDELLKRVALEMNNFQSVRIKSWERRLRQINQDNESKDSTFFDKWFNEPLVNGLRLQIEEAKSFFCEESLKLRLGSLRESLYKSSQPISRESVDKVLKYLHQLQAEERLNELLGTSKMNGSHNRGKRHFSRR